MSYSYCGRKYIINSAPFLQECCWRPPLNGPLSVSLFVCLFVLPFHWQERGMTKCWEFQMSVGSASVQSALQCDSNATCRSMTKSLFFYPGPAFLCPGWFMKGRPFRKELIVWSSVLMDEACEEEDTKLYLPLAACSKTSLVFRNWKKERARNMAKDARASTKINNQPCWMLNVETKYVRLWCFPRDSELIGLFSHDLTSIENNRQRFTVQSAFALPPSPHRKGRPQPPPPPPLYPSLCPPVPHFSWDWSLFNFPSVVSPEDRETLKELWGKCKTLKPPSHYP